MASLNSNIDVYQESLKVMITKQGAIFFLLSNECFKM